ncbi:hypothetical protein Tco_1064554, partial [Tanacetum coccineum]
MSVVPMRYHKTALLSSSVRVALLRDEVVINIEASHPETKHSWKIRRKVKKRPGPCLYSLFVRAVCARAIYRTEVCTEMCADVIYPIKVVSEPGYDKQRQKMKGHFQNQCSKLVASRDKDVNQAARDFDDALVCCVENTVEDHIMDSGASFHAAYCKEELERSRLRSGKVRLADDKTLDIASVGDVVLKTSFGTSWTLKEVRYIPGLKRRLISVGQFDEEGYHAGFGDQQWWVTKGSLVARLLQLVTPNRDLGDISRTLVDEHVSFKRQLLFKLYEREDKETIEVRASSYRRLDPATMILLSKTAAGVVFYVENGIVMLKMVPETPLQFGVAERFSRTFRVESTGLRAEAPKMLWADSVSTTYLIYCIPYVLIGLRIPEEEWRGKDTSLAHLKVIRSKDITFKDSIFRARSAADSNSLMKPIQKSQVVSVDIPENLAENDSIVTEHGLSLEITQSPSESSNTSEGSENSRSFEDSGRLDEEYSEDGASSKEGGSETPQVRRSTRESKAPVRHSPSTNYLQLTENGEPVLFRSLELPAGKKASKSLWMFKVKEDQNGKK